MCKNLPLNFLEFINVAEDQLNNESVRNLANYNASELAVSLGVDEENKPKLNILCDGNLLQEIQLSTPDVYDALEDAPLAMFITWALNPESKYTILENVTTVAYYLAGNGVAITINGDLAEVKTVVGQYYESGNSLNLYSIANILAEIVTVQLPKISISSATETGSDDKGNSDNISLPADLIQHLTHKGSVTDIVREVIRLQDLSPAVMRQESAGKALVNAWRITH